MLVCNTRENIVKSSARLFLRSGYNSASMSDIASACGIQKGSIYHHFRGKEELLRSVLEITEKAFRVNVFCVAYQKDISQEKRLSIMLKFIEDYIVNNEGCLMTTIALEVEHSSPQVYQRIIQFYNEWIDAFKYIYKDYFTEQLATEISEELVVKIQGAFMWINICGNTKPLKRICSNAINRILKKDLLVRECLNP